VQKVLAAVGRFNVEPLGAPLVVGALRSGQLGLDVAIELRRFDLTSVAYRGERLQTEIDADLAVSGDPRVRHLDVKAHEPAAQSILDERSAFRVVRQRTVLVTEESVALAKVPDRISFGLAALSLERHPAESAPGAVARPEARRSAGRVTTDGKLSADFSDRLLMDAQLLADALGEFLQIEMAWPPSLGGSGLIAILNVALNGNAIVPDLIARKGVALQRLARRRSLMRYLYVTIMA